MTGSTAVGAERAAPFPWEAMIAHGLAVLHLGPDQFWRLTPRELAATLGRRAEGPPRPDELAALMRAFPDI